MSWSFEPTEEEKAALVRFRERHNRRHGPCKAAAGGRFSVEFTPTGLGTCVVIRCADCRKKRNVTDFGSW